MNIFNWFKKKDIRKQSIFNRKVYEYHKNNSSVVRKAIEELRLAGYYDDDEDGPNLWMRENVVDLLTVLSSQGHSGMSVGYAINLFTKLANHDNITPLTFKDEDFSANELDKDTFQHKRKYSIFKSNNGIYDINSFHKVITHSKRIDSKEVVKIDNHSVTGTIFEMSDGIATGRGFRRCYFKDKDIKSGRIPKGEIGIKCLEVEVNKDDYLSFVEANDKDLLELDELFDIEWFIASTLKGEVVLNLTNNHGY